MLDSWGQFGEMLRWGEASGLADEPRRWWWELRPHVAYGTLEVRVCDAQSTLADAATVAAFAHALVAWLAERHEAGESLADHEVWRISENRFVACRHGLDGRFADLRTGERRPVRDVLRERLQTLIPVAERIGCADELAGAESLIERNGSIRQRDVGLAGVTEWLADRFLR